MAYKIRIPSSAIVRDFRLQDDNLQIPLRSHYSLRNGYLTAEFRGATNVNIIAHLSTLKKLTVIPHQEKLRDKLAAVPAGLMIYNGELGSGKSTFGIKVVECLTEDSDKRSVWTAHSNELCDEAQQTLLRSNANKDDWPKSKNGKVISNPTKVKLMISYYKCHAEQGIFIYASSNPIGWNPPCLKCGGPAHDKKKLYDYVRPCPTCKGSHHPRSCKKSIHIRETFRP
ncbi:hypothetical protein C8034_v010649 [Colletotrichum sidae]|uniref:Uncharacterized protein n=1 Tax=Colletotrichum sidae TaxID=1347389 RepID=A0A4R8T9W8_9PEZI|nr:hypothetical protein C8034_v010649 [Colletotrichum sidae]